MCIEFSYPLLFSTFYNSALAVHFLALSYSNTDSSHSAYTTATDTYAFFMSAHVTLKCKHLESYALRFISKAPPTGKYDVVLFIHSDLLWTGGFGLRAPLKTRFSAPSRPAPRPTQSPAQWVRGLFPGDKASRTWR